MGTATAVREKGIVPEGSSGRHGHRIYFWDLRARRNVQTIDLGANHQMALEARPAHDPIKEYGFVGVVVDTTNLEGSIWTWWREGGKFHCKKTAVIPPSGGRRDQLPPLLQGFGAVPPLITSSTSRSTTGSSMRLAGAPAICALPAIRTRPSWLDRCILVGSRDGPSTQMARRSAGDRRWSRSVAMASKSTGLTRSIRPGTTSSIRAECLYIGGPGPRNPADPGAAPGCLPGAMQPPKRKGDS